MTILKKGDNAIVLIGELENEIVEVLDEPNPDGHRRIKSESGTVHLVPEYFLDLVAV